MGMLTLLSVGFADQVVDKEVVSGILTEYPGMEGGQTYLENEEALQTIHVQPK